MKSFDMIVNIDVHYLRSSSFYSLYEYFSDANLHNLLEFPTKKTQKSSINERKPLTVNHYQHLASSTCHSQTSFLNSILPQ